MYQHSPGGNSFNDYGGQYGGQWTQAHADNEIAMNIRTTAKPVGALVDRGRHAFDVTGFYATADPLVGYYDLYGFYVIDPWYPMAPFTGFDGATYGLTPDWYISLSDWNSKYFRPYSDQYFPSTIWTGYYIIVARMNTTSNVLPADTPPYPTWADGHGPLGSADMESGASPASKDLTTAVLAGLAANGLTTDSRLGTNLDGVSVGRVLHVDSLDASMPPYELVELQRHGAVLAIALVNDGPSGYSLGSVRATQPGSRLPTQADGQKVMGAGVGGVHFAWRASLESESPFFPIVIGTDALGGTHMLTLDGSSITAVHASN